MHFEKSAAGYVVEREKIKVEVIDREELLPEEIEKFSEVQQSSASFLDTLGLPKEAARVRSLEACRVAFCKSLVIDGETSRHFSGKHVNDSIFIQVGKKKDFDYLIRHELFHQAFSRNDSHTAIQQGNNITHRIKSNFQILYPDKKKYFGGWNEALTEVLTQMSGHVQDRDVNIIYDAYRYVFFTVLKKINESHRDPGNATSVGDIFLHILKDASVGTYEFLSEVNNAFGDPRAGRLLARMGASREDDDSVFEYFLGPEDKSRMWDMLYGLDNDMKKTIHAMQEDLAKVLTITH